MILQVGALNETVEVKSEAGLNVTQPDVSHTVNEKYYRDLPIVTAGDVRLAESVLQMQPGYLPMKPNGDPMFRGSQFQSRINGGQRAATENFFDGAAFGYASGHQQSQESTPPVDSVQEVKVTTTSYSAQYGHTSGGFIEYTAKTGTNAFHGSGYGYFADDAFNKKGFFAVGKTPLSNNNYGATLGGPVIRNKTFFFGNFDYTRLRSGVLPGFGNTTPTDAFKAGDFSALLTGNQIGTDALGRPIFGGQIFNPATTRQVNGVFIRDPYPGNQIPAGDPLRSQVAAKIAALMVHPDRAGTANQRGGQPGGRPDLGPERAEHAGPAGPQFHAEFQGEHELLLEPPALDSQLRRNRRVHDGVRRGNRAGEEQHLLRTGILPAHLDASCPPAVRLGHSQQPVEPHARLPGTAGSWAGIPFRPVSAGRSCCGAPTRAVSSTTLPDRQ